jgi:murein DD-endopeptidase MepM/ murein hydrolase activator NlpD
MKALVLRFILLACLIPALVSVSCTFGSTLPEETQPAPVTGSTPTPEPTSPPAVPDSPTLPLPSPTPPPATEVQTAPPITSSPPAQQAAPSATPPPPAAEQAGPVPCAGETCSTQGSFLLERPVGPDGRNIIDPSNRFGSYEKRTRAANHGVSFLNSSSTPVLAAAAGTVVVAGDDSQTQYGLYPNSYGNLVVLQHSLPGFSQPVYTLYAHLSQISVNLNDTVQAGQVIGLVGMSGSVEGSTLDFEVRFGENAYSAVRNPELWLKPLLDGAGQPLGALAGRVLDAQGQYLPVHNILLERLGGPAQPAVDQVYLKTYSDMELAGASPWEESFAVGDLPAGDYQVSFWLGSNLQQRVVQITPGQLTFVTFQIQ